MARDIKSPLLLYLKALLFLVLGIMAGSLLLIDQFSLQKIVLLTLTIWGFCRAYYFVFYVIQHYLDPGFKYSGLWHFLRTKISRSSNT